MWSEYAAAATGDLDREPLRNRVGGYKQSDREAEIVHRERERGRVSILAGRRKLQVLPRREGVSQHTE